MGQGYLIDTNALIDFTANALPMSGKVFLAGIIDQQPAISIINKIELLSFSAIPQEIHDFIDSATIYMLTDSIIAETISIRRNYKFKLPDAIIAATAKVENQVLVIRNLVDFQKIPGLDLLNLHEL